MVLRDLISKKNYDYIEVRATAPKEAKTETVFFGCCKSKNGVPIPLNGESYDVDEEILSYEEWENEKIQNGLTIVIRTDWL